MSEYLHVKDVTSNPAPLGLMRFALTTILLNIHNAGCFPVDKMIMGMGIFFGGIAQFCAGIMEWKKEICLVVLLLCLTEHFGYH